MNLTAGEVGALIGAVLTALGTVIVTLWRYVFSPAIDKLRTSLGDIESNYEKKIEVLRDENKNQRVEYEQKIKELRADYEEKIDIMEARHSVQISKADDDLAKCQEQRETAILWKARYEQKIHELEKASFEGKITAITDDKGQMVVATANIAVSRMFGYTRQELIGMPVEKLIADNFRKMHNERIKQHDPKVFKEFNRVMNGGMALHKDGTKFPVTIEVDSTLVNGVPGWSAVINME